MLEELQVWSGHQVGNRELSTATNPAGGANRSGGVGHIVTHKDVGETSGRIDSKRNSHGTKHQDHVLTDLGPM
jgi:hypothetical protein